MHISTTSPSRWGGHQRRRHRRLNVEYAYLATHIAIITTTRPPSTTTPTPSSTRTSCLFCGGPPRALCRRPRRVHRHSLHAPAVCLHFAGDFAFDLVFGTIDGSAVSFAHGYACAFIALPLGGIPRGASASRVGTSCSTPRRPRSPTTSSRTTATSPSSTTSRNKSGRLL